MRRLAAKAASRLYDAWCHRADHGRCPCQVWGGRLPFGAHLCRWIGGPIYELPITEYEKEPW